MPILGLGTNTQMGIGIAIALEDRFSAQARHVQASLKNLKDKAHETVMSQVRDARDQYTAMAAGAGLVTAGIFNVSKTAASFEHQLRQIEIVGGSALGKTRKELSRTAFDIAQIYGMKNTEVGDAMFENVKAGLRTNLHEITEYQVAVANVAGEALGGEQGVAMGLINMMNSMKLNTSEFPRVANAVVAAANASTASVYNLNEAMQYFSNNAHIMGLSLEESLALIAKLSNSGIKGSSAGTALSNFTTQLAKSLGPYATPQKQYAWAAMGLKMPDVEALVNKGDGGILDLIDLIQEATAGMTRIDRLSHLNTLFNVRGQKGLINLFGYDGAGGKLKTNEGDPTTFREMLNITRAGVTGDIARKQGLAMADDFWTDIKKLGEVMKELGYNFYNAIRPVLRTGFHVFTKVMKLFTYLADSPVGYILGNAVAIMAPIATILFGFRAAVAAATIAMNSFATMAGTGGFNRLIGGAWGGIMGNMGGLTPGVGNRSAGFQAAFNKKGQPYVPAGHFINLGGKDYKGGALLPRNAHNWSTNPGGPTLGKLVGALTPGLVGSSVGSSMAAVTAGGTMGGVLGKVAGFIPKALGIFTKFIPIIGWISTIYSIVDMWFGFTKSEAKERKPRESVADMFYKQILSESSFGGLDQRTTYLDEMKKLKFNQTIQVNVNGSPQAQIQQQKAFSEMMDDLLQTTVIH